MIQLDHPKEINRWKSLRYLASKYNAINALPFKDWVDIIWKSRGLCFYCKRQFGDQDAIRGEHIYPLSKGGAHSKKNVVVACQRCNSAKSNMTPEEFLSSINRPREYFREYLGQRVAAIVRHRRYETNDSIAPDRAVDDVTGGLRCYEVWAGTERIYAKKTLFLAAKAYLWLVAYDGRRKERIYAKHENGSIVEEFIPKAQQASRDSNCQTPRLPTNLCYETS